MKVIRICAAMLWATSAFGQCRRWESPIDCDKRIKQQVEDVKLYWEGVQKKMELNKEIAEARARFWATYPNKPGAAEVQDKFADLLYQKDIYFLILNQYPQNRTGTRDTAGIAYLADLYSGAGEQLDNGIRRSAKPEFQDWSECYRKNVDARGGVLSLNAASNVWGAIAACEKEYRAYVLERDWAEFDAVGRVPVGYEKPDAYAAMLYFRFGKVPVPDAFKEVSSMSKLLGEDVVVRAAQQVLAAPKTKAGTLVITVREPVKTGPGGSQLPDDSVPAPENVIGSFAGPLSAFEALATRSDDRRYLLGLLAELKPAPPNRSRHIGKWEYARQGYDRYVNAFGAPQVLEVSHAVRVAVKRMIDGLVMDPKAIGAARFPPYLAFDDVLARRDPRGYVRWMLAFNQQLNSKAELDAAYQKFVAANEPGVLEVARKMAVRDRGPVFRVDRPEFTADGDLAILTAAR